MFGTIPAMPLWVITEDTVEQAGTLHRPGCPELDEEAEVEQHPAGSALRRRIAPRECWTCKPAVEMVLGV
jgi:hypothetical protein